MTTPPNPLLTWLMRQCYSLLIFIAAILVSLATLKALGQPNSRLRWYQRLGLGGPLEPSTLWFHCVSVGEVTVAARLIRAHLERQPQSTITLTTTTQTGKETAFRLLGDVIQHRFLPFDLPWLMQRLLRRIKPAQVIITEVELWPNLVHACGRANVPVSVLNARMTQRSVARYRRLSSLVYPMLGQLHRVCAQSSLDAEHYLALGLPQDRLRVTGNIKFDISAEPVERLKTTLSPRINPDNRPLLLGASTHAPEEAWLLTSLAALTPSHPEVLLVLVPRHPARFDEVEKLCHTHNLSVSRTSTGQAPGHCDVLLVDEMGVLTQLYGLADMALVGGSIAKRGGHNPLEAAVYGVPVIMGPHIYNNPQLCAPLKEAGALVQVDTPAALTAQLATWLGDPKGAQRLGQRGKAVIDANSGALAKSLAALGL